jgi:hypothetical protein
VSGAGRAAPTTGRRQRLIVEWTCEGGGLTAACNPAGGLHTASCGADLSINDDFCKDR